MITKGSCSGDINITLYYGNGKVFASATCLDGVDTNSELYTIRNNAKLKMSKGTYYIKISKSNKNASGYYQFKWK